MRATVAILFSLFFLMQGVKLRAQETEILLTRYSTSDGLPDNSVRAIFFDSKGFMWIGTEEGLSRFDGEEFINYSRSIDGSGLSGNVISDIVEDEEGWLWLATRDGGICRFNPETGEVFSPSLHAFGDSEQNYAYSLALFPDGGMMVGTDKGIYLSHDRKTFQILGDSLLSASYKLVFSEGKIYTAGARYGLRAFDRQFNPSVVFPTKKLNLSAFLNTVYIDDEKDYWLGTWDNYCVKIDPRTNAQKKYDFLPDSRTNTELDEVKIITGAGKEKLWFATGTGTLWEFDKRDGNMHLLNLSQRERSKLYGDKIYCLLTDKYERIWIGTNNGLHVYDKSSSRFEINYLPPDAIVSSFEKMDDELYIGTLSGLFKVKDNHMVSVNKDVQVYSLLRDTTNELYVGANTMLRKLNTKSDTWSMPLAEQNYDKFQVNSISASRYSFLRKYTDLLFANAYGHGIVVIKPDMSWGLTVPVSGEGVDNLVNGMFEDSKGRLWAFGTLTGLILCNTDTLIKNKKSRFSFFWEGKIFNRGLQSKHITAMAELSDGSLWVSTLGGGLYHFTPESEEQPFIRVESPYQSIHNMVKSSGDQLWMIVSGLVMGYNHKSKLWSVFNEKDGIPKEGLNGSLCANSAGDIFAGGRGFYIHFNSSQIPKNTEIPNTIITHLRIGDKSVDHLLKVGSVDLPYDKNFITINFSSLCFTGASSVRFKYKLKGMDDDWWDNGTLNSVTYSTLPSGKYIFMVKGITAEGVEDSGYAQFAIHIRPPFYKTWWFVFLVGLLISITIYLIIHIRQKQFAQLELVRNKIARDLHDDIGSALGSISFFSETAKRTLENNNRANTELVLEKIGTTSREMIENMHDIVWAVNPRNDSFDQVILRMKNYATDMAAANNVHLIFTEEKNFSGLRLSMTERKNLFLIFKETLYNSIKYAECSEIKVTIKHGHPRGIHLIIKDNGIGFDINEARSRGNGLKNMKIRADEIKASFVMQSSPGNGTEVQVTLHV